MTHITEFKSPEDVYYYMQKLHLDNILNIKNRQIIVCNELYFFYGIEKSVIPDNTRLAIVTYKSGERVKGIIINDMIILPFGEEGFMVSNKENEDFVIVGSEIIYDFRSKNISYSEQYMGVISSN